MDTVQKTGKNGKITPEDDQAQLQDIGGFLKSTLHLSRSFLHAESEGEVIQSLLEELSLLLAAFGASYIPFDDQKPPQMYHHNLQGTPSADFTTWIAYLSAPAIRSQCRICQKNEPAFQICPLLSNPFEEEVKIYCFRVVQDKSKHGVVTLFLPPSTAINESLGNFLHNIAKITALAIAKIRQVSHKDQCDTQESLPQEVRSKLLVDSTSDGILQERSRLAREYHDGLAQILAFLKIQLSQIEAYLETGDLAQLAKTARLSHQAVSEAYIDVREAIDDLHQNPLKKDFFEWLRELIARFMGNFEIDTQVTNFPKNLPIAPESHLHLTRIIQEAFSNIRKHSQASHVDLEYHDERDQFLIVIKDNGLGFDPDSEIGSTSHGLLSMRERARMISADLSITSVSDRGTTIRLRIPKSEDQ